jgi:hypothetical protein
MTIFKYPFNLKSTQTIELPDGAQIIHVGLDPADRPCMWAMVNPDHPKTNVEIYIIGTGHNVPILATHHMGSFKMGQYMWHVFR